MRLEVAAGERPTSGFVHHDARALPDIEIVCDIWDLYEYLDFHNEMVSEIRATHFLEHFSHNAENLFGCDALARLFYDILVDTGTVYIEVPNGEWQVKAAASGEIEFTEFVRLAYGDQDYPGNAHFVSFSPATLETTLSNAGFRDVQVQDVGMVLCAAGRK